jgi:hypothetical protein
MALKKKDPDAVTPFDLLHKRNYLTSLVGKEEGKRIAAERIALCEACVHFTVTRQCSICKCFMDGKVLLASAYCAGGQADPPEPLRWNAVTKPE